MVGIYLDLILCLSSQETSNIFPKFEILDRGALDLDRSEGRRGRDTSHKSDSEASIRVQQYLITTIFLGICTEQSSNVLGRGSKSDSVVATCARDNKYPMILDINVGISGR